MAITDDIKDTARKAVNKLTDTTQKVVGITKSPKELAKRMVEHLTHAEYKAAAEMLSEELNKYVEKTGMEDNPLVKKGVKSFEHGANAFAEDLEHADYKKASAALDKLAGSIPDELVKNYEVFKAAKKILTNISEKLNSHGKKGTEPDFGDLASIIEDSFKGFESDR